MSHTLTRNQALVDLTVTSTTGILIDDYIVGATTTDSTTAINEAGDIDASQITFDVDDGTQVIAGTYIKIDSETMLLVSISTNTLTVIRGVIGSTAVLHLDGASVFIHDSVGIVGEVIDITSLGVYEMNSNPFAPIENITTVDSAVTTSCTATGAYAAGNLPSDACLVEGTDATVTNIFRQIADVSGIGGVSNPSSTQTYLGLEMVIYIGRRGQSAATYAISQEEKVVFGYSSNKSSLKMIGNSNYTGTLRVGVAKYKDNDLGNFPPLYCQSGSYLKFDCGSCLTKYALNVDVYGSLLCYRTTLEGNDVYNSAVYNIQGEFRLNDVQLIKWGSFSNLATTSSIYMNYVYVQEQQYAWIILSVVPQYSANIFFQNSVGCDVVYSWGVQWESTINGIFSYDDNGHLITGADHLIEIGIAWVCLHAINSDVGVDSIGSFWGGTKELLKENTFKLTVLDENGDVVEGASVELKDENGTALFTKLTAVQDEPINVKNCTVSTGGDYFYLKNHPYQDDDFVAVRSTGAIPTPFVANTGYYVVNRAVNTFQLSETLGGSVINITSTGSGTVSVYDKMLFVTPNNNELSVGDTIKLGAEKIEIISKPSATTCELEFGKQGTTFHEHGADGYGCAFNLYKPVIPQTNASGVIEYNGTGTVSAVATNMSWQTAGGTIYSVPSGAFTLTITKSGYETYKAPIIISGYNGIDIQIKLKNRRFVEQKSRG